MANAARRIIRRTEQLLLAATAVLFAIGLLVGDTFFFRLATEALIFGGLALAVDLLLGIVGLLSLGHALYFGFGAYLSALLLKDVAPSFWLAMGVVLMTAALFGYLSSFIALRSKGVYFALITFGLAQVGAKAVYNTRELGASDGIIGIPIVAIGTPFGSLDTASAPIFFLVTLSVIALLYGVSKYLLATPMGDTWRAVRVNESRLPFIGFDTQGPKRVAFTLAAVIAATSGALYPMLRGFVSPELMYFSVSGNAVVTVILGGVGTLIGPLLGSALLTGFKSIIGTWTVHHQIAIGLIFIVMVIAAPGGIVGIAIERAKRRAGEPV